MTRETDDRVFDRELSWLSFNERVLQEAADPDVPLLERLKFLAIFSSNLDEFFRVRVASLRSLVRLNKKKRSRLGFSPGKLVKRIRRVVNRQQQEFGVIFVEQILPGLRDRGIYVHARGYAGIPSLPEYAKFFETTLAPILNPVVLPAKGDPPFLGNRCLYLIVELWPETDDDGFSTFDPHYGLVAIPAGDIGRFVVADGPEGQRHVVFIDDVIRAHSADLFPEYDVGDAYSVKLTRDADLYLDDEFGGDLVKMIAASLSKRASGIPTRLLYDPRMPYPMVSALKRLYSLDDDDLVPGGAYHNFSDFFGFPDFADSGLQYEAWPAVHHPVLGADDPVWDAVKRADQLLHVPYQRFDPVIRFLEDAASDPHVTDVAVTLYRVARDSKVVMALIAAAKSGKHVTAFVEVKARFDEQPNISWGERMEKAGVRVLYSKPGIKVHAKLALIGREELGAIVDYAYLSTGNFNEKTANTYTDLGLFTADPRLTRDVRKVFLELASDESGGDGRVNCEHILVAPHHLRDELITRIDREIGHASSGRDAEIILKLNSLEDQKMIEKLYEASQAGVSVRLIIRGICCLKPGVPGLSERITAISIVDRYLEHARVFYFANNGDPDYFLSSADWMKRNLNRRIEVAFPVYDQQIRQRLDQLLAMQFKDTRKARFIDANQNNSRPKWHRASSSAQASTYRLLASEAAALEATE